MCCKRAVCSFRQHLLWVCFPTVTNRERGGCVPINDRWASGWKGRHGQTLMKRQVRGVHQVSSWKQKEGSTKSTASHNCSSGATIFSKRGHHSFLKQFKGKSLTAFAICNELNHIIAKNTVSMDACRFVTFKPQAASQYLFIHQLKEWFNFTRNALTAALKW